MKFEDLENAVINYEKEKGEGKATRYYSGYEFNAYKALTKFVRELEEVAKNSSIYFEIVAASPRYVVGREIVNQEYILHENDKAVLLERSVQFIYGNYLYSFELNDNPFMNSYVYKIKLEKDEYNNYYYFNDRYAKKIDPTENLDINKAYSYNYIVSCIICNKLMNIFENMSESASAVKKWKGENYKDIHFVERNRIYIW